MVGITMTRDIKNQFDERVEFLENRIAELHQQFHDVKKHGDQFSNYEWKTKMLCHRNELGLRESILKDVIIIESTN